MLVGTNPVLSRGLVVACGLALGCGVEASRGGFGFDTTPAPTTAPVPADDPDDDDDASSGAGESSSSSSDDGEPPLGSSSEESSTTTLDVDPSGGESTGGDVPDGMQPAAGMYATCIDANVCAPLTVCMQILDAMMMPTDGFCTSLGCSDPSTQCLPAPGGTATPSCYAIMANGMPDAVCALDCGGGKTCPTGMTCRNLTGGMVCI